MRYVTYNDLNKQLMDIEEVSKCYNNSVIVLLSHKHEEVRFILKIKEFFNVEGIDIKIDWLDPDMPQVTDKETTYKIRQYIMNWDKFILIASENSKKSLWIPWELGFADGVKGLIDIAILPITYNENKWKDREYYNIYNFLRYDEDEKLSLCNHRGVRIMSLLQWINKK